VRLGSSDRELTLLVLRGLLGEGEAGKKKVYDPLVEG
jgi:hypothetical protein